MSKLFALSFFVLLGTTASAQGEPLIRIETPEFGKDSTAVTREGSITIVGKAFSGTGIKEVVIGNKATGQQTRGTLKGEWGDFTAQVELASGENTLLVLVSDVENRFAKMVFRVVCEGQGAIARVAEKPKPTVQEPTASEPERKPEPVIGTRPAEPTTTEVKKPASTASADGTVFTRDQVLGGAAPPTRIASGGTVHAVVVGISRYENDPALELRYAVTDAQAFGDHLLASNGLGASRNNVMLLMNGEASSGSVRYALRQAAAKAGPDDLLLFYFAGHGINDGTGRLCLLPYDVGTTNAESMWATGLTQSAIADAMGSSRSTRRLIVLDACQSGLFAGVDGRSLAGADASLRVLTATSSGESAHESEKLAGGHGLFSYCLMKGLKGDADASKDGSVTLTEVSAYLKEKVNALSVELGGGPQHPVCHGTPEPEIVLGRPTATGAVITKGTEPSGTARKEPAEVEERGYRFVAAPVDMTEVEGVVFADAETMEKVRFFEARPADSKVSGMVNGQQFYGHAVRKGKSFEFADMDDQKRQRKWSLEMNTEWTELWVSCVTDGGGSITRTLHRIGVPERVKLEEGRVFIDPVQDHRLEVVEQNGAWMRLSGNIGTRIVDLVAHYHGDVYDLIDAEDEWKAQGRMVMSDTWNGMTGSLTFGADKVVPFALRLQEPITPRVLGGATYRDMEYPKTEITFYDERNATVRFNGQLGPGKVDVQCWIRGDVLLCVDNTGQLEPFRMLLKNDRKKLVGSAVHKTQKGTIPIDMIRVGGAPTK